MILMVSYDYENNNRKTEQSIEFPHYSMHNNKPITRYSRPPKGSNSGIATSQALQADSAFY